MSQITPADFGKKPLFSSGVNSNPLLSRPTVESTQRSLSETPRSMSQFDDYCSVSAQDSIYSSLPDASQAPSLLDRFKVGSQLSASQPLQSQSGKVVYGSQFRIPPKASAPCEMCDQLDKGLRKSKETIRSLRMQIAKLEEKLHDATKGTSKSAPPTASAVIVNNNCTIM